MIRKRVVSFVLCLCMVLSLLPVSALAVESNADTDIMTTVPSNDSSQDEREAESPIKIRSIDEFGRTSYEMRTYAEPSSSQEEYSSLMAPSSKLAPPTNLRWETQARTYYEQRDYGSMRVDICVGSISWTDTVNSTREYEIEVYNEKGDSVCRMGHNFSNFPESTSFNSDVFATDVEESGTYRFSIRAVNYTDQNLSSDPAYSDTWTYTKPAAKLPAPTGLNLNNSILKWNTVSNADGYEVEVTYSQSLTDEKEFYGGDSGRNGSDDTETDVSFYLSADADDIEYGYDGRYHHFRVRCLSNDITKICNSPWSNYLTYDCSTGTVIQGDNTPGQGDDTPDTPPIEVSDKVVKSSNLTLQSVVYEYTAGGRIAEMNKDAVGGLNITFVVADPASVCEVRIATWSETLWSDSEINSEVSEYISLWKEPGKTLQAQTMPYTETNSRPVRESELGKTEYILLVALGPNMDAVGYAVIQVAIPAGESGGDDNPGNNPEAKIVSTYPESGKTINIDDPSKGTSSENYQDGKLRIFFDRELDSNAGRAVLDFSVGNLEVRMSKNDQVVYSVYKTSESVATSMSVPLWGSKAPFTAVRLEGVLSELNYNTEYYVVAPKGFFKFADGTSSQAIQKGDWTFRTAAPSLSADSIGITVPQTGFSVWVLDEKGNYIPDTTVIANNVLGTPSKTTDSKGFAVFNSVPSGNGDIRKANLTVYKDGYQRITVDRKVAKGDSTSVTIFEDDGKPHISSVIGTIDDVSIDLLSTYKYFKANSRNTEQADNNVKTLDITVGVSSSNVVDRYQLLQDGKVVAESISPTISIPLLTGTPSEPSQFGDDWRITKLDAGKSVYLRVVDHDGNTSEQKKLALKITSPSGYDYNHIENKGKVSFFQSPKISIPSEWPILGGFDIELGSNTIPFEFEIQENGKVKIAINPKIPPLYEGGGVDGTSLTNWDEIKKDYDDAIETVALGRASAARAFGGKPQPFGAGKVSVNLSITGYGEGYLTDNGTASIDVGVVVKISQSATYQETIFLGYVPVYFAVGEKFELSGKGQVSFTRTNEKWSITGGVGEITPSIQLNGGGGFGASGVLSVGVDLRGTLSWLIRLSDNYNRLDFTAGGYIVAQAFLFKAEKKFVEKSVTLKEWGGYLDENADLKSLDILENLDYSPDFYNETSYKPIPRDYLNMTQLMSAESDTVKSAVFPDASPRLVHVGNTAYLFWLDDVPTRSDNDRTALVYATSDDFVNWSAPIQVIAESDDSTADLSFDLLTDGNDIHIALCKANQRFGDSEISLDQMAASADIYYIRIDTESGAVSSLKVVASNDYSNAMPSIAKADGEVMVSYVENQMEDGFFGANNTHNICRAVIDGETGKAKVDGLITALTSGLLNGDVAVAYVVDSDRDYNTDGDCELYLYSDGAGVRITDNTAGEYSPTFANIGGTDSLLWYSDSNIRYIDNALGAISNLLPDDSSSTVGNDFYVISGDDGNAKVIWNAPSLDESKKSVNVYALAFENGEWSSEHLLCETESDMTSKLSGYSLGETDYISYLNVKEVSEDTQVTDLKAVFVAPNTDIALLDIDYNPDDLAVGERLPMVVTVQNIGGTSVESIDVSVGSSVIATLSQAGMKAGETKSFEIAGYTVPSDLNGVQSLRASVKANGDSNSVNDTVDFSIGYTDVSVSTSQMLVNGEDWASISITNESPISTDVTLKVVANHKDGPVVYEKQFANVSGEETQVALLNLNSFSDTEAYVFYVTATPEKEEIRTSNNNDLIYLGLGQEGAEKYELTVVAGNGGTVQSGMNGSYAEGEIVSLSAIASNGYEFVNWVSSAGGTFANALATNTQFTMPAANTTVTAIFKSNASAPIYSGSGGSGGGGGGGGGGGNSAYAISLPSDVSGGKITVKPTRANRGTIVTITVSPDDGYELESLSVIDNSNKPVELTEKAKGKGQYKFTMPDGEVTVEVSFKSQSEISTPDNPSDATDAQPAEDEEKSNPFTDVHEGSYYYDAVLWATENGITNGKTPSTFEPGLSCTRAQTVTFLWRAAGSPEPVSKESPFSDISENAYFYKAVLWAVEQGITKGTTAKTFAPGNTVSRAQVVTFLYRSIGSPSVGSDNNPFVDVPQNSYYTNAVAWASGSGVTQGKTSTTFSPTEDCNRGQIVTFLYRHFVK